MSPDTFIPYILPEVLGCPDPMINQALVLSAIDFCRETSAWSEILDPILLVDGQQDYVIAPPADAYTSAIRDVWLGSVKLEAKTMQALQLTLPNWTTATSTQPSYYNSAMTRGSIRLYPIPMNTVDLSIVVRAAYTPLASATTFPDFLGQEHLDILASGAKSRLMAMPGASWSNPAMAAFYKTEFDNGVIRSKVNEAHDRVVGSVTVTPRRFGF